jgi:hypothetical protein
VLAHAAPLRILKKRRGDLSSLFYWCVCQQLPRAMELAKFQ